MLHCWKQSTLFRRKRADRVGYGKRTAVWLRRCFVAWFHLIRKAPSRVRLCDRRFPSPGGVEVRRFYSDDSRHNRTPTKLEILLSFECAKHLSDPALKNCVLDAMLHVEIMNVGRTGRTRAPESLPTVLTLTHRHSACKARKQKPSS